MLLPQTICTSGRNLSQITHSLSALHSLPHITRHDPCQLAASYLPARKNSPSSHTNINKHPHLNTVHRANPWDKIRALILTKGRSSAISSGEMRGAKEPGGLYRKGVCCSSLQACCISRKAPLTWGHLTAHWLMKIIQAKPSWQEELSAQKGKSYPAVFVLILLHKYRHIQPFHFHDSL